MKNYFSLITFSHSVFALPFALLGFFLATLKVGVGFSIRLFLLVILCMLFARSAAMAFNRYLDRDIDEKNPRTALREIPAGVISPQRALLYVVLNSVLFMAATWLINPLCFLLSPVALAVVLGYSYTKRFTYLCHFVLGLGLALAPIGAYLAAGGGFDWVPILYSISVLLWVSGFDIIYALQDEMFDKSLQLHSIPVKLGRKNALLLSSLLHIVSAMAILTAGYLLAQKYPQFSWIQWIAAGVYIAMLYYQHTLVKPNDLSRVNRAFFTSNGIASVVFGALMILDIYF